MMGTFVPRGIVEVLPISTYGTNTKLVVEQ
jgi:hypothetical protein